MNDERVQQVLQIEKQAQEIFDSATRDAEQLLIQAEQEAETLIEKTRTSAQEEARQLVAKADAKEERERILAESEENINRTNNLAKGHLDRAVGYVLDRVAGRQ
jgi:vacuolar-type H+-ATPase subunit H